MTESCFAQGSGPVTADHDLARIYADAQIPALRSGQIIRGGCQ